MIANHVRSRRLEIGLNVGQLAERTGISKGMLSKIENAQTSPSLSTLERLSSAPRHAGDLPVPRPGRGERRGVRQGRLWARDRAEGDTVPGTPTNCSAPSADPTSESSHSSSHSAESTEVFPLFQHPGIEILYMLDGTMEYSYGREHYRMERGDTLQFEGDIPHGPTKLMKLPDSLSLHHHLRRRSPVALSPVMGAPDGRPGHGRTEQILLAHHSQRDRYPSPGSVLWAEGRPTGAGPPVRGGASSDRDRREVGHGRLGQLVEFWELAGGDLQRCRCSEDGERGQVGHPLAHTLTGEATEAAPATGAEHDHIG